MNAFSRSLIDVDDWNAMNILVQDSIKEMFKALKVKVFISKVDSGDSSRYLVDLAGIDDQSSNPDKKANSGM